MRVWYLLDGQYTRSNNATIVEVEASDIGNAALLASIEFEKFKVQWPWIRRDYTIERIECEKLLSTR